MTETHIIPNHEGEYTPDEAQAFQDALDSAPNLAESSEYGPRALKFTQNVISEWSERMTPLHTRWRVAFYMLAGNTISTGPEDVHIPELYKALETLVPRVEEQIIEHDPWFRIVPRRAKDSQVAQTKAAYIDWLFDQAKVRETIQPAARDAFVCQSANWHARWDTVVKKRLVKEEVKTWTKDGRLKRSIRTKLKEQVVYAGPRVSLVDPLDFVIDPKAIDPQSATYVGHRVWVTIDEVRRLGKMYGWANLGNELRDVAGASSDVRSSTSAFPRDPTARGRFEDQSSSANRADGRPERIELLVLYARYDAYGNGEYEDYQFVVSGGRVLHECKRNQNDNDMRPYATGRVSKNGHEFYGIGTFDNAVRLNQHLDRIHQIVLRGAEVTAMPFIFAGEDSNLPDSLYKVRPLQVIKGAGDVRFTNVPDGFIRSATMVIQMLQRNIEETVGAFRIQMGQDNPAGTATEATLSLQEGNRRMRGAIRGIATGLGQLLEIIDSLAKQHSVEDVEFPVLGKRALDLKRDHVTISPADLLPDVQFDLVGLHSMRTYGLKATGLLGFASQMGPFIMNNPGAVDQVWMMHQYASETIGPEDADRMVRVPTPVENLHSQEEENEGLIQGAIIEVDRDDPHDDHLEKLQPLWNRARNPKSGMPHDVRKAVLHHYAQHIYLRQQKMAQEKVMQQRTQANQSVLPPEAGGQRGEDGSASPVAGGMSDALRSLPGQTSGETPGPERAEAQPRAGGSSRPTSQLRNQESE